MAESSTLHPCYSVLMNIPPSRVSEYRSHRNHPPHHRSCLHHVPPNREPKHRAVYHPHRCHGGPPPASRESKHESRQEHRPVTLSHPLHRLVFQSKLTNYESHREPLHAPVHHSTRRRRVPSSRAARNEFSQQYRPALGQHLPRHVTVASPRAEY